MCMQDIKKCTWPEPSTNIIEKYYTCSSRRPSSNDYQSLLLLRKNTIAVATFLSFLQKKMYFESSKSGFAKAIMVNVRIREF